MAAGASNTYAAFNFSSVKDKRFIAPVADEAMNLLSFQRQRTGTPSESKNSCAPLRAFKTLARLAGSVLKMLATKTRASARGYQSSKGAV